MTLEVRSGPPIEVRIGTKVAARVECGAGVQLTPGAAERPALPWDLQIVRTSDGEVLWTGTITDLPQWMVVVDGDVLIGLSPAIGPVGLSCPT